MMAWLMRLHPAPTVIDGLLAYQLSGSPIPALIALAAPILRRRITRTNKDQ
ncbi:hypothetical protein V474_09050 [Novosphingobium barchaimii LL02]|uniref:Uncharacterized protein n=1 Tax=Novosphingobium barchaimii LL02 TaxID=1114963 RepID=A0A0J7Y886_9SPHN|nr:hypothetical protein [Novosphingobium barchaimii]KMS60026.1 hypothetical protein V474_09050 [Novosphingobium barchaimii LL02]